jgi:uncharacterized protein YpmS
MALNIDIFQLGVNLRCLCSYQANGLPIVTQNGDILVNIEPLDATKESLPLDHILSCVGQS